MVGFLLVRAKRQGPTTGVTSMVGEEGYVYRKISPKNPGQIYLRGAYWTALSDKDLEVDTIVRVVRAEGTKLYVEPYSRM